MARRRNRVDLEGVEDLQAAIKKLSENMQGEILRDAVMAGAEIVADTASQLAPRSADGSHGHEPGFLSKNIRAERVWTRTQDTADAHVGLDKEAWYGRLQETGTVFQPAQPFLRPAFDETKNSVVDEIAARLRARIERGLGGH